MTRILQGWSWAEMLTCYAGKGVEKYLDDMWKKRDEAQGVRNAERAASWRARFRFAG